MIFNSFQFVWLFPLVFVIYWICHSLNKPHFKLSKYFLLIVSYGVCMQWDASFGVILLFVTLAIYSGAFVIKGMVTESAGRL